jgi:ribosomal protein L37E
VHLSPARMNRETSEQEGLSVVKALSAGAAIGQAPSGSGDLRIMKLSRRPCEKCGEDTLHNVLTCTACGNIAQMRKTWSEIKHKRFKRLVTAIGNPFIAATAMIPQKIHPARKADHRSRWSTSDGPGRSGSFGRGRARTRA